MKYLILTLALLPQLSHAYNKTCPVSIQVTTKYRVEAERQVLQICRVHCESYARECEKKGMVVGNEWPCRVTYMGGGIGDYRPSAEGSFICWKK